MNKKATKIILDIVMTALLVILMDLAATGFFWHEFLGLLIFGLFAVHKALNWQWIKGVTLSFFNCKIKAKTRFLYVLDTLLVLFMCMTVISGILISESLFTFINVSNKPLWVILHSSFSYSSLILVSVHLGMHWESIMAAFRKMFSIRVESKSRTIILRSLAVLLVVFGIKNSFAINMSDKIFYPLTYASQGYGITSQSSIQTTELVDTKKLTSNISLVSTSQAAIDENTTLEEYLGNMNCTACHRHCSLLSPQCGRGVQQAEEATSEYNSLIEQSQSESTEQTESTGTLDEIFGSSSQDESSGSTSESNTGTDSANNDSDTASANDTANANNSAYEAVSLVNPFTDFIPIMSLYVAGTYYTVRFMDKKKSKAK